MSRAQDPPGGFFSGNPFKMLSSRGSTITPKLQSVVKAFESKLANRLKSLVPKDKNDILTFSWMKLAMVSLCETHNDIKTLISDLEFPVSVWDEKWIDVYLDISVKLLDLCNAFSSELTRLNQGHLVLQFAMHNLASSGHEQEQDTRACSSLDRWRQIVDSQNSRVQNCRLILDNLLQSLSFPKIKNSAKGKVLMRAMYGVKVQTLYVCSVFAAAFSGNTKSLLYLNVSDAFLWAPDFSIMQNTLNAEIKNIFLTEGVSVLKELSAVDSCVKKLYPVIQNGGDPTIVTEFKKEMVSELRMKEEKLYQGIDDLSKEVDIFFKVVLTQRDALLCNLRTGTGLDTKVEKNVNKIKL